MTAQAGARMDQAAVHAAAFEFVKMLAESLSAGKVELPSFPDVAIRVRKALADERTNVDQIVRIVGSEPALAARLLKMANSAALNRTGKPITELRTSIARMGYNMVRSAAISFAMAQIRAGVALKGLEKPLQALWERSTHVAAFCYVLAKNRTKCNPDEAFLTGLLHGVGRLYILARVDRHPALFADPEALEQVMREWHASIGKAILESWGMAEPLVEAVGDQDDTARAPVGPPDLGDVLICSNMMVDFADHPETLELNMQGVAAFQRLALDAADCARVLTESKGEIDALRQALGQ